MAPVITRTLLERLPKAELHCHLDGSLRPATMLELARDARLTMPRDDAEALADFMLVRDARNLEDYLARFDTTLAVMQTAESLDRIAYELAEDAAREGVRYLEVRFAPILNVQGGLSLREAVEAPLRGLARAERDHDIVARIIICSLRHLPPGTSLDLARLAVDFMESGVVGFDLAGGELGHPASTHVDAFSHARTHGLACTCHAGEGDGAQSIWQAVHQCGASRIGHATRLYEDPILSEEVKDARITLEICLTSNVQTHAARSYDSHPLRQYFDQGLHVVLNTDNRLMSGVNLVDEYQHAANALDFTFDELARIALNGFESAFLPEAERERLVARARADIEALRHG
ncbi:MAG: adenosine deaminase [Gemmatimonadetes bacterium]|nr:adenosine deaminase [Gemmatimonadota bacterium]MCC6770101.1 adenosine deaminase [Gemmatimonadaceae bacterium]